MKTTQQLLLLAALWWSGSLFTMAQVPETLSYQGRVTAWGTNFTGTGLFKFALVSPSTNVALQATATATVTSGFITSFTITDPGVGYTTPPSVIITDATGSGATASATVSGGGIIALTVENPGSGYSATPVVTIDPPAAVWVAATYWSNDGTSTAGSEPTTDVAIPVTDGLFNVLLGDVQLPNMQALPAQVFEAADVQLRVWFSDGINPWAVLSPDQPLGAVGYAMMAAQVAEQTVVEATLANGAVTTPKLANGSVTTAKILNGTIVNADVSAKAGIEDTKLATITTPGKVDNKATSSTSDNAPDTIVLRDGKGGFSAGAVSAVRFDGDGSALTGLNAANLASGTVPDARISAGVARDGEIMPTVLANDGHNSGLDADLLDGNHSTAFVRSTGPAAINGSLEVQGPVTLHSNLVVYGSVSNAVSVTRFVSITVGDMLHTTTDRRGDFAPGISFPANEQNGGSITFALPSDYVPNTTFTLELYLTPTSAGSGNMNFYARWTGYRNDSSSTTGSSFSSTPVIVGSMGHIHKQVFTLPAFSGTLPEVVSLTVRRDPADTYVGEVALTALRLSYQANR